MGCFRPRDKGVGGVWGGKESVAGLWGCPLASLTKVALWVLAGLFYDWGILAVIL